MQTNTVCCHTIFCTPDGSRIGTDYMTYEIPKNGRDVLKLVSRGYVLELGKIVHSGPSEELLNSKQIQEAYLGKQKT